MLLKGYLRAPLKIQSGESQLFDLLEILQVLIGALSDASRFVDAPVPTGSQ
jgi:hypothetical protein